jgi:hypothetical protein
LFSKYFIFKAYRINFLVKLDPEELGARLGYWRGRVFKDQNGNGYEEY